MHTAPPLLQIGLYNGGAVVPKGANVGPITTGALGPVANYVDLSDCGVRYYIYCQTGIGKTNKAGTTILQWAGQGANACANYVEANCPAPALRLFP